MIVCFLKYKAFACWKGLKINSDEEEKVSEPPAKVQRMEPVAQPSAVNLVNSPAKLLVKPSAPNADGRVCQITPKSAGWGHVGFEVFKLKPGQKLAQDTGCTCHPFTIEHLAVQSDI